MFSSSIRGVLLGAPLASAACVLVVLVLVGNLNTEQHQTTTTLVTGTVHEAIAADQLQHAITSTHARVYRTLLWSSMDVEVVDPRAVADEIRTELSLIQAHGLNAATTNGSEDGRLKLVMAINETTDLVLMDCQMPVMDGYEAYTQHPQAGWRERKCAGDRADGTCHAWC